MNFQRWHRLFFKVGIFIFIGCAVHELQGWIIQAPSVPVTDPHHSWIIEPISTAPVKKGSWTILVPAATPENEAFFEKITKMASQTFGLSIAVSTLFEKYKESTNQGSHSFLLSVVPSQATVPVTTQALKNTVVSSLEKTTFTELQEILSGTEGISYVSVLTSLWAAYAQKIQQETALNNESYAASVAQAPFVKDSTVLSVYTQLVGEILTFLKIKIATLSSANFASANAIYFLQTEVPALDAIVSQVQTTFEAHFNGSSGDGYPSVAKTAGTVAEELKSNYTALAHHYALQKGILFSQFSSTLFQALATNYSPSFALSGSTTMVMGIPFLSHEVTSIFSCLQNYYSCASSGLSAGSSTQTGTSLGVYQTPQAAVQALSGWLGSLYIYAALIGKNTSEKLSAGPIGQAYQKGNATTDSFIAQQQSLISQTESFYQNGAHYFARQLDVVQSSAYAQISSLLAAALSQWKKAESLLAKDSFSQAIAAYQVAASLFQKAGMINGASVLKHRATTVTLLYYQLLLKSYQEYYQTQIAQSITTMQSAPQQTVTAEQAAAWHSAYPTGFLQLFYYDPGTQKPTAAPMFQGIAWLCTKALPACLAMLNTFQLDTTKEGKAVQTYLCQSITVLQTIINGSQQMFYNTSSTEAADAQIGSLTVKGAVAGFLHYSSLYESFSKADNVLSVGSENGSNTVSQASLVSTLPFEGLFSGTAVSGFGAFSLLAQMYWSTLNSDPCLALAKQYPAFKKTLVSAALVLATYAQALCSDPSLKGAVDASFALYLQQKITNIAMEKFGNSSALDLVLKEGHALLDDAQDALSYESALACFLAAGLQQNADAQKAYFTTLDAFATWTLKNKEMSCPSLQAAFLYYRGVLAVKRGWSSPYDPATLMQASMKKGAQEVHDLAAQVQTAIAAQDFTQAFSLTKQLAAVQKMLQTLLIRQKREQLLLGTDHDLFSVTTGVSSAGRPTFLYAYPMMPAVTFPLLIDAEYMSAELYYQQAQQQLNQLQKQFFLGSYTTSLQEAYDQLNSSFTQATTYFSTAGHFDMVLKVQQAATQAAAFSYVSSVIPSDVVTALMKNSLQKAATLTQVFEKNQQKQQGITKPTRSFTLEVAQPGTSSNQNTSFSILFHTANTGNQQEQIQGPTAAIDPTSTPLITVDQPDYLIRYNEKDLTQLAKQEEAFSSATQAVQAKLKKATASLKNTKTTLAESNVSYAQIVATAQKILGKKKSISTTSSDSLLVSKIVVPLYECFLVENHYTSQFSTLAQEVQRYSQQVSQLVTGGMEVAGTLIKTTYSLQVRMVEGAEHIFLITNYGPLQAIPRFSGELETALFYYTQYAQFFSQNPTTVQVGASLYDQIPDPTNTHTEQAFKYIVGTYLSHYAFYQKIVANIVALAPPKMAVGATKQYSFAPYASVYSLLSSAYSWIFSSLNSIQQVQQNEGIFWMTASTLMNLQLQQYQQFMHNSARFLVGYPLSASYKQVLKDIASLAYMATQCTQSASNQVTIFQALGDCYAQAGQVTATYAQELPQVANYPSSNPTTLPVDTLDFSASYKGCLMPQATAEQMPQDFTLAWKNYYGGSEFYTQAFNKYQEAYLINFPGSLNAVQNDQKSQVAWGQSIRLVMKAIAQRCALFGRNAFTAQVTPATNGSYEIKMGVPETFTSIIQQGKSDGSISAAQGFSALQGGAVAATDNQSVQNQYAIMKKMILEALIYCSFAQEQTNLVEKSNPFNKKGTDILGGQIIKCGIGYYLPGLQMLAAQQQKVGAAYQAGTVGENKTEDVERETPVIALPATEVSLASLSQSDIQQLVYSNTFPAFVDYCLTSLMKGGANVQPFSALTKSNATAALNDFVSQFYTLLQSMYSWVFLPASDQNNPEQLGIDMSAAIKAQEQAMIVNPQAYVG